MAGLKLLLCRLLRLVHKFVCVIVRTNGGVKGYRMHDYYSQDFGTTFSSAFII